ncbi:MAG: hypothetical protein ABIO92_03170 [Chloroflexia bacterium]
MGNQCQQGLNRWWKNHDALPDAQKPMPSPYTNGTTGVDGERSGDLPAGALVGGRWSVDTVSKLLYK